MTEGRQRSVFVGRCSSGVVEAIFRLHFPDARTVADLTYGRGAFWKWPHNLEITGFDLERRGTDGRDGTGRYDVAVVDPPFRHSRSPTPSTIKLEDDFRGLSSQAAITELYEALIAQASTLAHGIIVKTKDTIERGRFVDRRGSIAALLADYYNLVDVAVFVPSIVLSDDPKWIRQLHFRRQESYFLVGKNNGTGHA